MDQSPELITIQASKRKHRSSISRIRTTRRTPTRHPTASAPCRQARLTFATTHHAALKELARRDGRFANASMEFDVATARPTYRLVWGVAGASNAFGARASRGFNFQTELRKLAWQLVESMFTD